MGNFQAQSKFVLFCRKYYLQILLVLSAFIIIFGLGLAVNRPIVLNDGQSASWWEIVKNVQMGKGYKSCNLRYVPNCLLTNQETAQREPLPIYLFAFVGLLTNNSVFAFQVFQILVYLLTMFSTFKLAREIYDVEAGVVAAATWALYLPAIRLEKSLTGDLLGCLFVSYGFVQFVQIIKYNRLKDWISFGLLFGLAVLSRFAILALVVGLGCGYLLYLYINRKQGRPVPQKFLFKALMAILVFLVIYSPWVIRNLQVFHRPLISSSLVGYNLYRHNAIVASNELPHYVGPDEAFAQVQALIVKRPEIMTPINEVQLSIIFQTEVVKLIKAHPVKYVELAIYRFVPLWFNISVLEEYGTSMELWDYLIVLQQFLLLILFVFGLRRKDWMMHPILFGITLYLIAFLAVEAQLRYAVPIMSGVIAVASHELLLFLAYLYDKPNKIVSSNDKISI